MKKIKSIAYPFVISFFIFFVFFGFIFVLTSDTIVEGITISAEMSLFLSLFCCGLVFMMQSRIKIPEKIKEEAVHFGYADYYFNNHRISGKLVLTKEHLVFYSHKYSSVGSENSISLSDIEEAACNIIPNRIFIVCNDGTIHNFSVYGKKKWVSKINALLE